MKNNNVERLYYSNYEYNAARVLDELNNIITQAGGRVEPYQYADKIIIENRSLQKRISETRERIQRIQPTSPARIAALETAQKELKQLESHEANQPREVRHNSFIKFVYQEYIYYFQIDHNFLFDDLYKKSIVTDGKYNIKGYLLPLPKDWLNAADLLTLCNAEEIKAAATTLFEELTSAKPSPPQVKRERVYTGSRYHYRSRIETSLKSIDF